MIDRDRIGEGKRTLRRLKNSISVCFLRAWRMARLSAKANGAGETQIESVRLPSGRFSADMVVRGAGLRCDEG